MKSRVMVCMLACALAACVTVNVYFPTSAAERAAGHVTERAHAD